MPSELSEHHQPKTRSWIAKFRDTFRGLRFAVQEQSFRIHLVMATLVLIVTGVLGATTTEWLFLATAISAVMVTEILNTAIERIARAILIENLTPVARTQALAAEAAGRERKPTALHKAAPAHNSLAEYVCITRMSCVHAKSGRGQMSRAVATNKTAHGMHAPNRRRRRRRQARPQSKIAPLG